MQSTPSALWANIRFLLYSAVIHTVLTLVFLFSPLQNLLNSIGKLTPIEVKIVDLPVASRQETGGDRKKRESSRYKDRQKIAQMLYPRSMDEIRKTNSLEGNQTESPTSSARTDNSMEIPRYDKYSKGGVFHEMESIGLDEYNEMSPFLQALWSRVNSNLDYPEDFAKQRISGQVNIHLLVDDRGVFIGDFLEITGENELLQAYVASSLVHALNMPLPQIKWNKARKTLPVLLSFNFETYSYPRPEEQTQNLSVKNALLFERKKFVDPKLNENIETFFTKYFPPIIPIGPGFFYIDFVFAYKTIANYGKMTEGEKRKGRIDSLREQLSKSIHRSQGAK